MKLVQTIIEKSQQDLFGGKKKTTTKKPAGGHFVGPRGGEWADAKHTIPYREGKPQAAHAHGESQKDFTSLHSNTDHTQLAARHKQLESEARSAGRTAEQAYHGAMAGLHTAAKKHKDLKAQPRHLQAYHRRRNNEKVYASGQELRKWSRTAKATHAKTQAGRGLTIPQIERQIQRQDHRRPLAVVEGNRVSNEGAIVPTSTTVHASHAGNMKKDTEGWDLRDHAKAAKVHMGLSERHEKAARTHDDALERLPDERLPRRRTGTNTTARDLDLHARAIRKRQEKSDHHEKMKGDHDHAAAYHLAMSHAHSSSGKGYVNDDIRAVHPNDHPHTGEDVPISQDHVDHATKMKGHLARWSNKR